MTPAFQLHLSKLDVIEPMVSKLKAGENAFNTRQPFRFPDREATAGPTLEVAPAPAPASPPFDAPQSGSVPDPATSPSEVVVAGLPGEASVSAAALPPPRPLPGLGFTHVIFDVDGVLVDSERISCESLRRAILSTTGVDVPHHFPVDFYPVFGMDVRNCVAYYRRTCNTG